MQSVVSDGLGHKVSVCLKFSSRTIQITNAYAAYSPGSTFFKDTPAWIMQCPLPLHVVEGDFNTVMHLDEDCKFRKIQFRDVPVDSESPLSYDFGNKHVRSLAPQSPYRQRIHFLLPCT